MHTYWFLILPHGKACNGPGNGGSSGRGRQATGIPVAEMVEARHSSSNAHHPSKHGERHKEASRCVPHREEDR